MEKADWLIEDGHAVAYMPIIYTDFIDEIMERAQMLYPSDLFKFEKASSVFPLFNDDHSENAPARECIKVTIY